MKPTPRTWPQPPQGKYGSVLVETLGGWGGLQQLLQGLKPIADKVRMHACESGGNIGWGGHFGGVGHGESDNALVTRQIWRGGCCICKLTPAHAP